MDSSALTLGSSFYHSHSIPSLSSLSNPAIPPFTPHGSLSPFLFMFKPSNHLSSTSTRIRTIKAASSDDSVLCESNPSSFIPIAQKIKTSARAIAFAAAAFSFIGKFNQLPAKADPPPSVSVLEVQETQEEERADDVSRVDVEALKTLLQQKLEVGDKGEILDVLKKLVLDQPGNTEWRFQMARVLNEMGQIEEARKVFEEILDENPLSFEALFENSLLMDSNGEGEGAIKRLEDALKVAEQEGRTKQARDVRLIMAQILFLQKNLEEALKNYEELEKEDPNDFRPYFCKGQIYTLLGMEKEAREHFDRCRELSPSKFDVEGYLRTPMSRMKLSGNVAES